MKRDQVLEALHVMNECGVGHKWISHVDRDTTAEQLWWTCVDARQLLWVAYKLGVDNYTVFNAVLQCAESAYTLWAATFGNDDEVGRAMSYARHWVASRAEPDDCVAIDIADAVNEAYCRAQDNPLTHSIAPLACAVARMVRLTGYNEEDRQLLANSAHAAITSLMILFDPRRNVFMHSELPHKVRAAIRWSDLTETAEYKRLLNTTSNW